ncbi:MAG TPA: sulfurtransferase TusA family protein [Synergistales bacterium]|nr:sulfurtransferase TusA family protein [Synergistales bacterium]
MSEPVVVDAKGLSCPQPILETRKALSKIREGTVEVLVDTVTSRENVARFARNQGWKVYLEDHGDWHKVILTR